MGVLEVCVQQSSLLMNLHIDVGQVNLVPNLSCVSLVSNMVIMPVMAILQIQLLLVESDAGILLHGKNLVSAPGIVVLARGHRCLSLLWNQHRL